MRSRHCTVLSMPDSLTATSLLGADTIQHRCQSSGVSIGRLASRRILIGWLSDLMLLVCAGNHFVALQRPILANEASSTMLVFL